MGMLMVCLVSVTAYDHGGGGHAGHSSSGYRSSSWGGRGGGGGGGCYNSDDSNDNNGWCTFRAWLDCLFAGLSVVGCLWCIYVKVRIWGLGDPHHGYLVVPEIPPCESAKLTTPCAGPDKKHDYRCGDHVAILVNGTYVRAVFSRVEEDIFPPRAEFSFVMDSPARTCEHQRLLEVETGLISRTCLLSAKDMYDGQRCQVAPVEFVGFAPATLEQVMQNIQCMCRIHSPRTC